MATEKILPILNGLNTQSYDARFNCINFIAKIFNNILKHPGQGKYCNLNYDKIVSKLQECPQSIKLLLLSGFTKDENESTIRLINSTKLETRIKNIENILQQLNKYTTKLIDENAQQTFNKKFTCLILHWYKTITNNQIILFDSNISNLICKYLYLSRTFTSNTTVQPIHPMKEYYEVFTSLIINKILQISAWDPSKQIGGTLRIICYGDIIFQPHCGIDLSACGYKGGTFQQQGESFDGIGKQSRNANNGGGGGGNALGIYIGGGGGSYGSKGENGKIYGNEYKHNYGFTGEIYGNKDINILRMGSGGGGGGGMDGRGGDGGGGLYIKCYGKIIFKNNSFIKVNGRKSYNDGGSGLGWGGGPSGAGSGSGGSVYIECDGIKMDKLSYIYAIGGIEDNKSYGGNGGDGRIKIVTCKNKSKIIYSNIKPCPYVKFVDE
eukprot:83328_1